MAQNIDKSPLLQKQTLNVKKQSIEKTLSKIEQLGNFTFAYSGNTVDLKRIISINVTQQSISKILRQLFPSKNYQFKSIGNQILIYTKALEEYYVLSGYVKEKETQESLPEATIYIPQLDIGVTTNNYGFFSIKVKKGIHNIEASYLGYMDNYQEITLYKDEEVLIELSVISENMEEVVITAPAYNKPSKLSQMSSLKLTNHQLKTTPVVLGEKDILKTLQLLPGVQSGAEGSAQVYIRGGSPDQNLTILDEATVYNSNHLFGFLSVYNVDAVKSTKIYKGAFPATYGGRLSGVADITMKDGDKEHFSGSINLGLLSSSFLFEGPIKKHRTSFLISGRRSFVDLIAKPFQVKNKNQVNLYFYDMNIKLHHIIDAHNNVYLSSYFGRDSFTTISKKQANFTEENLSWGNVTTTARWNHQYNNKLFSNLTFLYSNYSLNANYEQSVNFKENSFKSFSGINDYGIKASFDYYPNTNHNINFGLQGTVHHFVPERKNLLRQNGIESRNEQQLNSRESALYFEDVITLSQKLKTTTGIRLNYFKTNNLNNLSFEPRLSLAYEFLPNRVLKASYTKMNQFVHLLSNTGIGLPTDLWVSSTKNVAPQRSEQLALGFTRIFDKSGYSLETEAYYKTMKNVITYKEGASFIDIQDLETGQNISWEDNITSGKGWAYGAELLFRKQKGKLQGWLGYTLSWSQRQFEELNRGKKFFSKYDQRHNITLVSTYIPSEKTTWSASWTYQTGTNFTVPNLESLSGDNDFPINTGGTTFNPKSTSEFITQRNNIRGEATHRLNVGVQFHKKTKRHNLRTWSFSIYNIYARKNPFYYYVSDGKSTGFGIGNSTNNLDKSLRRVSALVFIPSINYSYKF